MYYRLTGSRVWGVGRSVLANQSFGTWFPTAGTAMVFSVAEALSWDFVPPQPTRITLP